MSTVADRSAADGWRGARRRPRASLLMLLLVVAGLHLWLLWLAQQALHGASARPLPAQATLVLVRIAPPAPAPPPAAATARDAATARPPRRTPLPEQTITAEPAPLLSASRGEAAASAPQGPASVPATAATGTLLDTDASRRAIRAAARERSTGELGAQATGEKAPLSDQDRMGQEIARGARGDCLKGEYAGSGMGLLSLPFWLIAELREKCRR